MKKDIWVLIAIAIIMKVIVLLTTFALHSFMDGWDMSYYFQSAAQFAAGQLPYINFPFDYPLLALVPIMAAYFLMPNLAGFTIVFEIIMGAFDILTIVGIYSIAMHVWQSRTRAFTSGLLYAISLPVAYFTLTRFDPLPVCLMVWEVALTLYGRQYEGYLVEVIGFFTKIFSVITIPFLVIWNAKEGNIKKEILIAGAILVIPLLAVYPYLGTFFGRVNPFSFAADQQVYANTPTFLLHMYLTNFLHAGITITQTSYIMYAAGAIVFLFLFYFMILGRKSPVLLLTTLLVSLFTIVFIAKLHSPQYIMWYLPFLCLLASKEIDTSLILVVSQIIAYLEFPLLFGILYTNPEYLNPVGSYYGNFTMLFFSVEYLVSISLLIMIIRNHGAAFTENAT